MHPYEPPRHLTHLAKTINAARTNLGWGIHDDGSVGIEHIMSSNPFAGKAKVWGIANIDDNGDIQVVSNGPGNDTLDQPIPKELIDQIVHFYEGEGLNVRNVHESDPTKEKTAADEDLNGAQYLFAVLPDGHVLAEPTSKYGYHAGMMEDSLDDDQLDSALEQGFIQGTVENGTVVLGNAPERKDALRALRLVIPALKAQGAQLNGKYVWSRSGAGGVRRLELPIPMNLAKEKTAIDSDTLTYSLVGLSGFLSTAVNLFTLWRGRQNVGRQIQNWKEDRALREQIYQVAVQNELPIDQADAIFDRLASGEAPRQILNDLQTQSAPLTSENKVAEIEQGMKACPHCGENQDLHLHPALDKFECANCGTIGEVGDLINYGEDPDPDRNSFEDDPMYDNPDDSRKYDDWADYEAKTKTAAEGFSVQGAPVSGQGSVAGRAVRPDVQGMETAMALAEQFSRGAPSHELEHQFHDKMNEGMGTSFPRHDSPFINRGGSFYTEEIDDHFFETQKEAAPAGIPGDSGVPADIRNFQEDPSAGFILVSAYTTPDDAPLMLHRMCRGIVTSTGGATSHAAVVARGAGIPCIVQADGVERTQPGDQVTLDLDSGQVDVNGGDAGFQSGDTMRARRELVRFVWSLHHPVFSQVTKELTPEMAEEEYTPGAPDKSHQSMIEYLEDNGELDYNDFSFGVIYDEGTAEYYKECSTADQMEQWLKSTFPNQVERVVLKASSAYAMASTAAAEQEDTSKSPTCPECGSHTYDVIAYPNDTVGPGLLRCLNDGTEYKWTLIMNPKSGKEAPEGEDYDYNCPHCGEALTDTDLDEDVCPHCGGSLKELTASMIKEAPGDKHLPYATPKRNRQYEHILESCRKEHPEWSEDRCKELAARTVNKERKEKGETKSTVDDDCGCGGKSKLVFRSSGTEVLADGTEVLNEYKLDFKNGDRVETPFGYGTVTSDNDDTGMWNVQFDTPSEYGEQDVLSADELRLVLSSEVVTTINDTDGNPLKIGDLYLMHSTQYKIPDVVRITNINEKRIEAHIDSDTRGMFPIEIDPAEFASLGYSFEPYAEAATKEAIATPSDQVLYTAVSAALRSRALGVSSPHELESDPYVGHAVEKALKHFGDPESALAALNDADSFGNFMRYYSHKEAARALHLSPKRQKELINENPNGRARNFDKLNLDGTHYTHTFDLIPRPQDDEIDAHFLW